MSEQPVLSEREWQLVLKLLTAEARELPSEIHHTDNRDVHDELTARLQLINALIKRITTVAHAVPAA